MPSTPVIGPSTLGVRILVQATEVSVLEIIVVFEAVASEAIHSDVGKPDESDRQNQEMVCVPTGKRSNGRQQICA
jgi:hypothetical protein